MKIVCSYCKSLLGEKAPHADPSETHGICLDCFEHYAAQWDGLSLGEYLDRFDSPVVAVDHDTRVLAINRALARLQGIEDRADMGMLGGELMECEYARMPEGCGHTVHCKACAIRNTVGATILSGAPQRGVPATLTTSGREVQLRLSTTAHDGVVFLLIEDAPGTLADVG